MLKQLHKALVFRIGGKGGSKSNKNIHVSHFSRPFSYWRQYFEQAASVAFLVEHQSMKNGFQATGFGTKAMDLVWRWKLREALQGLAQLAKRCLQQISIQCHLDFDEL
jgi:hypothetical protein